MTENRKSDEPSSYQSIYTNLKASDEVQTELLSRLQTLPFLNLEACLCRLLTAMGYEEAHMLGREHFRGKNSTGGADIVAFGRVGVSSTKTVILVKQYYDRAVQARYVDELRGTMLRLQAGQGIIISTSTFSAVAQASAKASSLLPIRLIDADALVRLLIRYRVGVRPGLTISLKVDTHFFARLAAA